MKNGLALSILTLVVAGFLLFKLVPKTNTVMNKRVTETKINDATTNSEVKTVNLVLEITSPKDMSTINNPIISVIGKTSTNAEIFINEKEGKTDSLGNFSVEYELFEGENNLYISANDDQGNYAEKTITVYLETRE